MSDFKKTGDRLLDVALDSLHRNRTDQPPVDLGAVVERVGGFYAAKHGEFVTVDASKASATVRLPKIDRKNVGSVVCVKKLGDTHDNAVIAHGFGPTETIDGQTSFEVYDWAIFKQLSRTWARVSERQFLPRASDAADYSIGSGLTADGTTKTLDISSKIPTAALGQEVRIWVSAQGRVSAGDAEVVPHFKDAGFDNSITGLRFRAPGGTQAYEQSGFVRCNYDGEILYSITNNADTVDMAVTGYCIQG